MNKNYINKSIIPLTTALIISMVTSGCAKRQNKVIDLINEEDYCEDLISLSAPKSFISDLIDDNTKLNMIDAKKYFEEINTKYIQYIYALDLSKMNFNNTDDNNYIDFLYITNGQTFNSSFKETMFDSNKIHKPDYFFNENMHIIIPEDYSYINDILNTDKVIKEIKMYELKGFSKNYYFYYETSITFNEDIRYGNSIIHKGDNLTNKSLYIYNNSSMLLIANNQTGLGSDSENVINNIMGNLDDGFLSLKEYGLTESKYFDTQGNLNSYIRKLTK